MKLLVQSKNYHSLFQYISSFHNVRIFKKRNFANQMETESLLIPNSGLSENTKNNFYFTCDLKYVKTILESFQIFNNFITEKEEENLLKQVDPLFRHRRYEDAHWDYAILQFREIEFRSWNDQNAKIFNKIREIAFENNTKEIVPIPEVHILDLAKNGCIKPHVDAVRFCGPIIAGLSLLSNCVMRFALCSDPKKYVDVFLPAKSLYIMREFARYECTHEVLGENESFFCNQPVIRNRRISLLSRCQPLPQHMG